MKIEVPVKQMKVALYEHESLHKLLHYIIDVSRNVKGIRSKLAQAAGCQPSYLSQVLAGTSQLSQEQLFGIAGFLGLQDEEWDYVRELSMLEKAGNQELRDDCRRRLIRIRSRARSESPEEGGASSEASSISADDLLWYVSNWQVNAILAAVVSPLFRTDYALARCINAPIERVREIITQLVARKFLIADEKGELRSNMPKTLYLGTDAAGQVFRTCWLSHGISKSLSGYRGGFQKGGVFRGTRQEYENLKSSVAALHRGFFSEERDLTKVDTVGYFGIELFEV